MSGHNSRYSPPANASFQTPDGVPSQAWQNFLQSVSDRAYSAFEIGDYKQTSQPDLGPNWLLCDGRAVSSVTYPVLSKLLLPIFGAGGGAATFVLPALPQMQANGVLTPFMSTWVRAV